MTKIGLVIIFIVFAFSGPVLSQEYSYTHYDITDGLAGSTVYCITQDKDGFLWMGTETGVSRFDGTHFRNFTPSDGLPDIEILQMFGDSRGRVWMAPFKKSVCYYYKGSIHNQENDSLLRRVVLHQNIESFAEDSKGNILFQERTALHLITADGSVLQIDSLGREPIRGCAAVSRSISGHFQAQVGGKIIEFSEKGIIRSTSIRFIVIHPGYIALSPLWCIWRVKPWECTIRSLKDNKEIALPFEEVQYRHVNFSLVDDSLVYFNEVTGSMQYNIHTGATKRFLPGRQVSRAFRDATGNLWFTTLGEGIFRLNSDEFRTVSLMAKDARQLAVWSINRIGNELWVGVNDNGIFRLSLPEVFVKAHTYLSSPAKGRVLAIDTTSSENVLFAKDNVLMKYTRNLRYIDQFIRGIKSVFPISPRRWLVGTNAGAEIVDPENFKVIDTIWRDRTTVVFHWRDSSYIGTLEGLYRIVDGSAPEFLGEKCPFLRKRIASIAHSDDGILWIASYDNEGIIGYRHDSVVARITRDQGLTSNICRNLLVHNNLLWVGTDKGLNKIELDKPSRPVTRYTSNDGLGSDMINTVFADGDMVYVGTPAGLSLFDQARINNSETCRLYLLALINSGRDRLSDSADLVLPYNDKHVRFEFAGISYRSVGGIRYRYRMLGLDSVWRETNETYLEYPTLPSGHYQFQLQAENKFAIRSSLLTLPFDVTAPYWQSVWFELFVLVAFIALTWLLVSRRIRHIRRQQDESERLIRKTTEMENRALQAQMNPHFIFNCLNSIQQFVFDQDILASNQYISGFAHLIRATLHNSSKSFISITDEVDYLSTYLSLEKMRFKEKMDYTIEVDAAIDKDNRFLPPMLIQPYVENSMRHGLRHKAEGNGHIRIMMREQGTQLVVIVEDNGIGRKKAMDYKSVEHIEYQSKGMALTADRIKAIGAIYGCEIDVSVEDIVTDNGQPQGTRVVIHLPDF
jgi:Histidine kinase/Y_Y_Y domain/Two component regulator propeller